MIALNRDLGSLNSVEVMMKKRILILVLVKCLLLSLIGCGTVTNSTESAQQGEN